MKPTNKLRWVNRKYYDADVAGPCYKLVLQQWYALWRNGQETPSAFEGEWIDVPIEQE